MGNHPWAAAALAFALLWTAPAGAAEAPRVVVTVKPVHSLIADVMKGVGRPALLLPDNASPHAYAMRPSQAELLRRADMVIWVGPELESFLRGSLASLAKRTEILTLADRPELRLLKARRGDIRGARIHEEGHAGHGRGHGEIDPHLWLDPANAEAIARLAARKLGERDPANAERYSTNADRLSQALRRLDAELGATLTPVAARPYVVFHDALQYFERRYGLNAVGSLSASPERKPGARRMVTVRQHIRSLGVRCVFAEPQFSADLIRGATRNTGARTPVLDPLGAAVPPGPGAYAAILRALARTMAGCLRQAGHVNKERTNKHNLL